MNKKLLSALLILIAALCLAACSKAEEEDEGVLVVESNWEYENYDDYDQDPADFQDYGVGGDYYGTEWEEEDQLEEEYYVPAAADMTIMIDGVPLMVEWEDNDAVADLSQIASQGQISVRMSEFGGFEQTGNLPSRLSRSDREITAEAGDIVLYSGNKIVVFFGTHTWAYTPLGRIIGMTESELTEMLGGKNITLVIMAG